MKVTKEQIFTIADDLVANDQKPTLAAIRQALGGGSYTTIQEALKEWKAKQAQNMALEPPPQVVTEQLNALGAGIWKTAMDLANARLAKEQEVLETTRLALEMEQEEAKELVQQISKELEDVQLRYAEMKQNQPIEQQRLQSMTERAIAAEARVDEMEKRTNDLHTQLDKVQTDFTAEKKQLVSELAEVKKEAKEQGQQAAKLAGQCDSLKAQNMELNALLEKFSPVKKK